MNKIAVLYIFPIVFFLFHSSSFGQAMCHIDKYSLNSIKGIVVSNGPKGYEPISDAKVELWKYRKKNNVLMASVKTDKTGRFSIENIKKGEFVLLASKEEWKFREFRTIIKKVNQPKNLNHLWIRLGVSFNSEGCGDSMLIEN